LENFITYPWTLLCRSMFHGASVFIISSSQEGEPQFNAPLKYISIVTYVTVYEYVAKRIS